MIRRTILLTLMAMALTAPSFSADLTETSVDVDLLDLLSICPADAQNEFCTKSLEDVSAGEMLAAVSRTTLETRIQNPRLRGSLTRLDAQKRARLNDLLLRKISRLNDNFRFNNRNNNNQGVDGDFDADGDDGTNGSSELNLGGNAGLNSSLSTQQCPKCDVSGASGARPTSCPSC